MFHPEQLETGELQLSPCRQIPSVHELVESPHLADWRKSVPREWVVDAARKVLARYRDELSSNESSSLSPCIEKLACEISQQLKAENQTALRPVINATGIILHTGLGRSPLAGEVAAALSKVTDQYANVEFNLDAGERGRRTEAVSDLLCKLTGAESATVVNNNAAATLMVLAAVVTSPGGQPKNVIVSRGELIEIGGSFRLPQIMHVSGANLREVGTTNKTRCADYEQAIDDKTAALMKIHSSNYKIIGFTESVSIGELIELGQTRGIPIIDDIGSGAMFDFERFGLHKEPTAPQSIAAGADLVIFSGDKLLGGPQAGIILGKKKWIDRLSRHPLMRAVRVGKLTLAALEATLRLHRDPQRALREIPVLMMAGAGQVELKRRADQLAAALQSTATVKDVQVSQSTAYLGGGAFPAHEIMSMAVQIRSSTMSEAGLAKRLRKGKPAVVPRVQDGAVWLDLRTVLPSQDAELAAAVRVACDAN